MTVSSNFIGSTAALLNSIRKNQKKRVLIKKLNEIDRLCKYLNINVNYQKFNNQIQKRFFFNLIFFSSFSLFLIASTFIYSTQFGFYICQLQFFLHFIQMQCFYLLVFLWTIEHRIKLLSELVVIPNIMWNSEKLFVLKLIIMNLIDIIIEFRNVFALSLFASVFQIYMSALINTYWLSMALLDLPDAYFLGKNIKHL